jgi:hypothetical protein
VWGLWGGGCIKKGKVLRVDLLTNRAMRPPPPPPARRQNQQQKPADVPRGGKGAEEEEDEEEQGLGVDVLCERCYGLKHEG